jgi:hypothetical protein
MDFLLIKLPRDSVVPALITPAYYTDVTTMPFSTTLAMSF